MGYTTYFSGEFEVQPPLEPQQVAYLMAFNATRRMKRNAEVAATLPDAKREAVGLPIGTDGAYYVGGAGDRDYGQTRTPDVLDYNEPPAGQPGLWCQWAPSEDGTVIAWDEGEKFYDYMEWLGYLVEHFLKPWGRTLEGSVSWSGEDPDDRGTIYARGHQVEAVEDTITNCGPSWGKADV